MTTTESVVDRLVVVRIAELPFVYGWLKQRLIWRQPVTEDFSQYKY